MDIGEMKNKVREALAVRNRLIHKDYYDVIPVGDDKCVFYYCSQQYIDTFIRRLDENSIVKIYYEIARFTREGEVSINSSMNPISYPYRYVLNNTPAQDIIDFARMSK